MVNDPTHLKIVIDGFQGKLSSLAMLEMTATGVNLTMLRPLSTAVETMIQSAVKAEQDRCCRIVHGQCSSDNVAERTVTAIRQGGKS